MDQIAKTALLAATFGASLLIAEDIGRLDNRTARELAVLSRVLARNLSEMRVSLAAVEGRVPENQRQAAC